MASFGANAARSIGERVVVIGAGIAGLAAARMLREQGFSLVTVLESRHRAGGRIHSVPFAGGILDAGASWIHGTKGNPLTGLVRRFALRTVPTDFDTAEVYVAAGDAVSEKEWEAVGRALTRVYRQARRAPESSVSNLLEEFIPTRNFTPRMRRIFDAAIRSEIELPYATDAEDLSARALQVNDEFPGPQVAFPQGMGQLVDRLAQGLDIRFRTVVSHVKFEGNAVRVICHSDKRAISFDTCAGCHVPDRNRTFPQPESDWVADRVVVAVPLSILRAGNIEFAPALPAVKREALRCVRTGTMNKVMLQFKTRFWPADASFLQFAGGDRRTGMVFFNPSAGGCLNTLVGLAAGGHARAMEGSSDDEVRDGVMVALKGMFGSDATEPISMYRTRWHSDPHALGAYPYLAVGGRLSRLVTLSETLDGKIFFAGDGTHPPHIGTAHGAYLSGVKAARAIADAVGSPA